MKIYLETYGCTANKSDHCTLEGILRDHHHTIVSSVDRADTIILLTCTVIDTTEQRILSRIKILTQTQKKLIIAGCMPVVQAKKIKKNAPMAYLITPQELQCIPHLLKHDTKNQETTSKEN